MRCGRWLACTLRAGGSLLPPMLLHTTINSFSDFVVAEPGRYERAMGLFSVLTLIAAVAVLAADYRIFREHRDAALPGRADVGT